MGGPQRCLGAELSFGGGPHGVRLRLAPAALEVEVEALSTAQRWRGRFDAAAVEELTRRTGNFKRFGVFCAMLEAALTESSPAVSLELLTYGDLQALRCRGGGAASRGPPRAPPQPGPASPGLGAKRYLLLVYCVEFDRIHYPLPLPPADPPDPDRDPDPDPPPETEAAALRRLVRGLRDELRRARAEVRGLEAERLRDEARRRRLEEELREAREALGTLRARVQALTAELAACRRGRRTPPAPPPRDPHRSGSRDGSRGRRRSPSPAGPRAPRFDPTAFVRARERRRREAELQKQRRVAAPSGGSPRGGRGRSSSAESLRSRCLALSSGSEAEPRGSSKGGARSRRPLSSSAWNSPGEAPWGRKQPAGSGAGARREKENVAELWDIDARLQALQECLGALHARQ